MSCGHEHEDGAYVLGALSPEERAAFERHLPGCKTCARSVRELAGLPGLLARVPAEVLDPDQPTPPVPDTLLPSLVRRARRTQRRRTWAAAGLVAAAVAVVGVSIGIVATHDDGPPSAAPTTVVTTAAPRQFTPIGSVPISGWVSLTPVAWGTRVDLTCTYEGYAEKPVVYSMVLTRKDGSVEQVASWKAFPGRTMHIAGATSTDVDDIARVDVLTATGRDVLELVTG
ncbi:MAG: zf-HC2 domain-containing protein [Nocardioidaceae bacterium]|nr:zf-HC2 domain-containing protein [Nocardioidaceae bacterium]